VAAIEQPLWGVGYAIDRPEENGPRREMITRTPNLRRFQTGWMVASTDRGQSVTDYATPTRRIKPMALLKSTATAKATDIPAIAVAPLGNGHLSPEQERIAELEAQLKALKAARQTSLVMKVSDKGALSVYGLQRWPVSLYREQWERLLKAVPDIAAFIEANSDRLSTKPEKPKAA
jgi:hypothetical protein